MAGALAGVRVIDMTNVYSGPLASTILGDQGADIVKIEKPGGDIQRNMPALTRNGIDGQFSMLNRNKRSIVIDLNADAGKAVLRRFIQGADVLMQNFRPGVMDRLGLTEDHLRDLNPRLVYAAVSGVGATGPYAGRRVYDAVIQAISGAASLQPPGQDGRPVLVNTLVCDKVTAITAAQVITSALFAREKTGEGQRVEISMLDASLFFLWPDAMVNSHFVGDDAPTRPRGSNANMVKKTADGYIATMPVQRIERNGVLRALNLTELLGADGNLLAPEDREGKDVGAMINEAYQSLTTEEACARLEEHQVPFARINGRDEVVDDPQVQAMGALVELEHPTGGTMRQPRPPGRFSATPADIFRHAPGAGEQTDELLAEIDFSLEEIAELRSSGVVA